MAESLNPHHDNRIHNVNDYDNGNTEAAAGPATTGYSQQQRARGETGCVPAAHAGDSDSSRGEFVSVCVCFVCVYLCVCKCMCVYVCERVRESVCMCVCMYALVLPS